MGKTLQEDKWQKNEKMGVEGGKKEKKERKRRRKKKKKKRNRW